MSLSNKVILFFTIHILFLLSACNNDNKFKLSGKDKLLHLNVSDWNKDQKISKNVIKSVKFIPLETREDCILNQIIKIIADKDKLYILDKGYNKKILVYDNEGKYMYSIGKYGRGPGEYISLNDFIVDGNKKQLLILDSQLRKVLIYNLNDGNFLNELKIDFWAANFVLSDGNILSFYTKNQNSTIGTKYSIVNVNLINNSYKWFVEQDVYDTNLSYPYSIYQSENTYYAPYFKDIVYRITKNDVEPFITFDFGTNKIPKEKLKNKPDLKQLVSIINEGDWTYGINNVVENKQFLTLNLILKQRNVMVIYSKETGNYFYGSGYEGGLGVFPLINNISVNNNHFLGVIDPFVFMKMDKNIFAQSDEELKVQYLQTLNTISEQSNPIIFSIEYNKF